MKNNRFSRPLSATMLPGFQRQRHNLRENLLASAASLLAAARKAPRGNRRQRRAGLVATMGGFAYALSSLFAQAAWANPTGGAVVAGQASIVAATPQTLNVIQGSDKAIINWQGFSIAAGETVNFLQPNAQSVTLNRVIGTDPSAIFGSITANGTVMLVNPNGVFFGKSARVDVGGLVATTANITDADFLAGNYAFSQASTNLNAGIVNEGLISIKDSGLAALVAPSVQNSGIIQARLGKVALGGARSFTLDFQGDGLLSFDAGSTVTSLGETVDGTAKALVVNSGQIAAEGGTVVLSARAVKGIIDNVINTDGVISATSISGSGGKIVLSGGTGKVQVAGTLDASGTQAGQSGGTVIVDAADIQVASGTRIDASGDQGGGSIAIGSAGSRDGAWAAGHVDIAAGATMAADALTLGNGGTVTVLSEQRTDFAGTISAKGGTEGGDGGFAEVSSHDTITLTGGVDLSAVNGATGTFLLDPATLTIVAGNSGALDDKINSGTLTGSTADNGANTVSASTLEAINATTNIVLEATGLITVDTSLNLQTGSSNSFTLRSTGANGGISFTSAGYGITTAGGAITLDASITGSSLTNIGQLTSNGGNITLLAANGITLAGNINAGAGTISIDSISGNIANVSATTPKLTGTSLSLSASGGQIGASGAAISSSVSGLTVTTGGDLYVSNDKALTSLSLNMGHVSEATTSTYAVTATGLTFAVTDGATDQTLSNISSTGNLMLDVMSDRGLAVGIINAGTGDISLTANGGNITRTGGSPSITGDALTLVAKGTTGSDGDIGGASAPLLTKVNSLSANAGDLISISNTGALTLTSLIAASGSGTVIASGSLTVGDMTFTSGGSLSLTSSGGAILDDGDSSSKIKATSLTLSAADNIGTSSAPLLSTIATSVTASAANGGVYISTETSTTFTVSANGGDIALKASGYATLSNVFIASGSGNIDVTGGTGITYTIVNAGTGNVTLTATSGNISKSNSGNRQITGNQIVATANGSSASVELLTTANEISASAGGSLTITQEGAVTLKDISSTAGSINITVNNGTTTLDGLITAFSSGGIATLNLFSDLVTKAGNKLTATNTTLTVGGAIGDSTNSLNTATQSLSVTNTGDIHINNASSLLSVLSINNKHNTTTPNTLSLVSNGQIFTIADNGTTVTISDLSSTFLTSFSFTSDKNLVLGRLDIENATTATVTTTAGSILDDGNRDTFLNAKSISLTATEGIGASGQALGVKTTDLTVVTAGDLNIANESHFNSLTIKSTHRDSNTDYIYAITGEHLDFKLTDSASGYNFERVIDSGYATDVGGLNVFSFTGDRNITLGNVNTGAFDYTYTSDNSQSQTTTGNVVLFKTTDGAILDDGDDNTLVLASYVNLQATRNVGAVTTNADIDIIAKGLAVTAGTASDLTTGTGGIYITVQRSIGEANGDLLSIGNGDRLGSGFSTLSGDVVLKMLDGNMQADSSSIGTLSGSVSLEAVSGSILGSSSTISASSKVTLKAGSDIGSSTSVLISAGEVDAIATSGAVNIRVSASSGNNSVKFNEVTAGGNISLAATSSNAVLGKIIADGGDGTLSISNTSSGRTINDDGDSGTVIQGSTITITTSGSIGNDIQLNLDTAKLDVSATGSIDIASSQALTDLTVTRPSTSSSVSITGTGQTLSINESSKAYTISTLTSATDLDFSLVGTGSRTVNVGAANVGSGGSFTITNDSAIAYSGSGAITAGTVSLTAGTTSSIGTSGNKIQVNNGRLTLSAGRNIYVASSVALTHLDITSTNSTTAAETASLFDISGASGSIITIADSGTTITDLDVSGGNSIVDFSFIGKKNIAVSEIVASGAVTLKTEGGGANSNITMSGSGAIAASSVTLVATGTGTGNGSIGTDVRAIKTSASSLNITSNGNVYLDNSSTNLTSMALTLSHKTAASSDVNTYAFTNIGSGRSLTLSESAGVMSVTGSSSSGTMDFALSVDRAIETGAIDMGTSTTGKISLTTTGGATGVAGAITRSSGTLTAGEVILTSKATGATVEATTSTKKLTIANSGDFNISNNTSLTDLTLNLDFRKSNTSYSYALSSTGLTFTVDEVVSGSSVSGFRLTTVSQSGLNLNVTSTKAIQVGTVNIGSGTAKLTAGTTSGSSFTGAAVNSVNTSSLLTAGRLEITGSYVGNATTGQTTFYGSVGTLNINASSTVNYANTGNLALDGISIEAASSPSSGTSTVTLQVNSGSLTQAVGSTNALSTDILKLTVSGGSIGTVGSALLINAETLELTSGGNVYFNNQADLSSFDWTLSHAGTNNYGITGKNLTVSMPSSTAAGSTTITQFIDTTGLDLDITVDTNLILGDINVQRGRSLTLTTTGTTKDITTSGGSAQLTAGEIKLTATGGITKNGSDEVLQTTADALVIDTLNSVYIDNHADLQTLTITNSRTSSDGAAAYGITSDNATIAITGSSAYAVALTDTTGINFTFDTEISQIIGIIDVTKTGTLTLKSQASIFGGANSSLSHITAGALSVDAILLGSSGNRLYIDAPKVTLEAQGDVYITSTTHIDALSLKNSSASSTANRTFDIVSAGLDGTAGQVQIQATHTNAGGTTFSKIVDTSGMDFTFTSDRTIIVDEVDIGSAGTLKLSTTTGDIRELDSSSSIKAGRAEFSSTNGQVGQESGTGGGLLDLTAAQLKVTANDGAYVDLKQSAKISGFTVAGTSVINFTAGDLLIGSSSDTDGGLELNGATTTINVTNGSILGGGRILGAGNLTLTASGSIGDVNNALTTAANNSGTTTLTATASGGGIYLTESNALTVSSLSAAGDVTLRNGGSQIPKDFTLAGALSATGHTVTITSTTGSIKSTTASVIDATNVVLSATAGSIGESTSSNTRIKTKATKLTLNTPGNIYVGSDQDLSDLTIDRAASSGTVASNGDLSITATNLTFSASDTSGSVLTTVTDKTGLNFTYAARGNNISVGTISVGDGDVTLSVNPTSSQSTANSITMGNGGTGITANDLTLRNSNTKSGSSIGASNTPLLTNVDTLTLSTTTDAYVSNAKALTTGTLNTGGALSVGTTSGDLTLNGTVTWGNSALTLEAAGALNSNGIGLFASGVNAGITLKAGSGIGTADTPFTVTPATSGSTGSTVSATVTGDGSAYLALAGNLIGGLTVDVKNGSINVTGSGSLTLADLSITDDTVGNAINVTSSGTITVGTTGSAGTVSAGIANGTVVLISRNGAIAQGHTNSGISGGTVTLNSAAEIGTSVAALGVNSRGLQAVSTLSGNGIYLKTSGTELGITNLSANNGVISVAGGSGVSIDLGSVVSGGGAIAVTASGNSLIRVGNVDAGSGDVTLNAGTGSIVDDGVSTTTITGAALSLTAGTGIGTSTRSLNTHVSTITGGTTGVGSVYIADSNSAGVSLGTSDTALAVANGALTVTAAGSVGVVNVTQATDGTGKDVTISTSGGAVTITKLYAGTTSSSGAPSSSQANITAATDILTNGTSTHIIAGKLSLTANNGNIGAVTDMSTGDGSPVLVKVSSISGLSAAKSGAVVSISNSGTGSSTLSSGALTLGTGASAFIKTAGDLSIESLSLSSGNLLLESGGTLTLPTSGSFSTTGTVTLKGTTDIVAGASGRSLSVTAAELVLVSGSAGGDTKLTTNAGKLNVSLTTADKDLSISNTGTVSALTLAANGDISFTNDVSFTADKVTATGTSRTITLTATTGDLTLDTVSADTTGTLTLNAAAGKILSASSGSTLTGETLNMTTFSGVGTAQDAFETTFTKISATVTGSGGIYLSGSTFDLGDLKTNDGDIEVTTTGNITDDNMVDGFQAGGSGNVTLVAGGTVTLNKGYSSTGSDTTRSGFSVQATSITLGNAISTTGAQSYTGNVTSDADFTAKSLSITGNLNLGSSTLQVRTIDTSAGNGDVSISGTLSGGTGPKQLTVTAGTGSVTIGGAASGLDSLSITAFDIDLASVSTTGNQTYTGAVTLDGTYTISSTGAMSITGATTLGGNTVFSLGTAGATLTGTVDGAHALSFAGTGAVSVMGAMGGTTALTSLVTSGGGTSSFQSVTSTGAQTYGNNVTLSGTYATTNAAVTFDGTVTLAGTTTISAGTGDVGFGGTVNGLHGLTVNSSGITNFDAAVGGTAALTSLTTDTGGSLSLMTVKTMGAQSYGDASVTLGGNLTSVTNGDISISGDVSLGADVAVASGSGDISITGTVNGAQALTLNSTGATTLSGDAGGTTALTSLTTDAGGTASLKSVTTVGAQTYNGTGITLDGTYTTGEDFSLSAPVVLAGDTVINTDTKAISISGTVNGAHALTLNSTDKTTLTGAVGGAVALTSFTTDAGGTSSVVSISTTGAQTFNDAVTLDGLYNTNGNTFTVESTATLGGSSTINAGAISFKSTLDGTFGLVANSQTTTSFNGVVGGTTALASLTTDAGGTTTVGNVTTTGIINVQDDAIIGGTYTTTNNGSASFGGAVTLVADTVVSTGAGAINFTGTVDGAVTLTLNSGGVTTVTGGVGITTALTSLTTDAAGSSAMGSVTTSGTQTYNDSVSLNGTYATTNAAFNARQAAVLTGDTVISTGSGAIAFAGTVNGSRNLTLDSSGLTSFAAAVGNNTALLSLITNAGGSVTALSVSTIGNQTYGDAATLNGNYVTNDGTFETVGALTLAGNTSISANGGNVTFNNAVDGAQSLSITSGGTVTALRAIGAGTALASLTTGGGGSINLLSVTTTGAQTLGGGSGSLNGTYNAGSFNLTAAVTLNGDTTINASSIGIGGSINGSKALVLNSSGAVSVTAVLGDSTALTSLVTDTGGSGSFVGVSTSGAQTYNDAATLSGSFTAGAGFTTNAAATLNGATIINTNGGAVTFNSSLDGAQSLTINAGAGNVTFNGAVGAAQALGALTINSSGLTKLSAIGFNAFSIQTDSDGTLDLGGPTMTTTGEQNYGEVLILSGDTSLTGSTITLAQGAQGAYSLGITGDLVLQSINGNGSSLTSLTVSGTTSFGGAVTTTGQQTYRGGGVVTASTVLSAGSGVEFGGALTGTGALTVNSSGTTRFGGTVDIGSLATDAVGSLNIGGDITTSGSQSYGELVRLEGTSIALTGSLVTLGAGADGNGGLLITGDAVINGNVGATNALGSLTISGTTSLLGATVNTSGSQRFGGLLTLSTDTRLTASSVTLGNGATGSHALTITGNAVLEGGAGTSLNSLIVTGNTILNGGAVSTAGVQSYGGAVTLNGNQVLTTTGGRINFAGTIDGGSDLTINAGSSDVIFIGAVGSSSSLGTLTINSSGLTSFAAAGMNMAGIITDAAGSLNLNGGTITTSGVQTYGEAINLAVDTVLTGSTVSLGHGVAGGRALTINGDAVLRGTIGVSSLSVSGNTVLGSSAVSTSGSQTYGGGLTLISDTVLTGTLVTVSKQTDGAFALTIQGNAAFGGALGENTALTALTVSGTTALTGAKISTSGAQQFGGAVTLAGDSVLTGGDVNFQGAVSGSAGLTVNSAGITRFGDAVDLGSLTTDAAGSLSLASNAVTTSGQQSYGERLTLTADTLLTGTVVTLGQGAEGNQSLTIAGNAVINGVIGGTAALSSLNVSGTTLLNGGTVNSSGTQTYGGNVTLGRDTQLAGSTISFGQAVDGAYSLGINGNGVISGPVGAGTALTSLTITGTSRLSGGGITTSGAQSYDGEVVLAADTTLSGASITLLQGADGAAAVAAPSGALSAPGQFSLTVNGDLVTGNALGAVTALEFLEVSGTSQLGGNVTSNGSQTYGGLVTLGRDITLTGSTITLNGADGAQALAIAGNGVINGAVGTGSALTNLSVTGTATLGATIATSGNQAYAGKVTLGADTVLTAGSVTFGSTVDGAQSLSITGPVSFAGAIGAATALTGLTVDSSATVNGGSVTTSGTQNWNAAVTLGDTSRINSGSGDVLFAGPLNGAVDLTVDSAGLTRFGGAVSLASLTTDTAGTLALGGGVITTSGTQTYGESAVLTADMVLTGTLITLAQGGNGQTDGLQSLTINGDSVMNGSLGVITALEAVSINGRSTISGTIITTGSQAYTGAVSLAGASSLTSNAGSLTFGSTVNSTGSAGLTLVAGGDVTANSTVTAGSIRVTGGNLTFNGAVTAATGAIALTSNSSAGVISFASGASIQAASGFTQTGGLRVLLPSSVVVTVGDINFAAPAELPAGTASISTNGTITMPGLVGTSTDLTLSSGTGALVIGTNNGSAAQTIQVLTLTVPTAGSATLFGSIGTVSGARAATVVNSPLRGAPYFINGSPWGPVEEVTQVVSAIVPRTPVPSTPSVSALFSGTVTSAGITPNALAAYQAPQVLTNVDTLGAGSTPQILETNGSATPLIEPNGSVGAGAEGSSSPSVITGPASGEQDKDGRNTTPQ
jgi:filamentous hemagglutinin family protein